MEQTEDLTLDSFRSNQSVMTPATRSDASASARTASARTHGSYHTALSNTRSHTTNSSHPDSVVFGQTVAELGIQPSEVYEFGWIAEIAMRSELPPGWTSRTDDATGVTHYVNEDTQSFTTENPLTPIFRQIMGIARKYLDSPSEVFIQEQKIALWQVHRAELDFWFGPLQDDEGNEYYASSKDGISSWHDPRQKTAYIYDLQCLLLNNLPSLRAVEDPSLLEGGTPWENGNDGTLTVEDLTVDALADRRKSSKGSFFSSLSLMSLGQNDPTDPLQQMQHVNTTTEAWVSAVGRL